QWISKRQAALRLGVSEKTIDRLRGQRQLDAFKLSDSQTGRVRISLASLEAYTARRQGIKDAEASPRRDSLPIPALEEIRAAKSAARSASGRRALPPVEGAA